MASTIIRLNVGGTIFRTTKSTLTSIAGSYFDAMFRSNTWSEATVNRDTDENAIFIDRGNKVLIYV